MNDQQVVLVPIVEVRVVNPRSRNRIKWLLVVQSIATVGLKRPITVARRPYSASDGKRYDLVCGQGRMEALIELGETMIPAIVIEAPEHDRQLMSLVENIARKPASTYAIYLRFAFCGSGGIRGNRSRLSSALTEPIFTESVTSSIKAKSFLSLL